MASTPPPSSSSSTFATAAMDSAALRSCPKCRRRMSSLQHDSPTICSHCREVVCSVETRCSKCQSWSVESMQKFLKYQKSLAGKRSKKPAVTAASVIQPAVDSSPVEPSPPSMPSVSEASRLKDAVLAVLQSLSMSGSLSNVLQSSARHYIDVGNVLAAPIAAPVGHPPPPLASSGDDQLRFLGHGPLHSASSSLSPTSLLFPLTPSLPVPPFSALLRPPLSASSDTLLSLSSSSAVPPPLSSSSSFSAPLPPYPSFAPSSLSSASFPSSSFVTASLPPSISSLFPSPFVSESSSVSSSLYLSFSSSFSPSLQSSVPPGFPPSSSSASSSSSSSFPPLSLSYSSSSSFLPHAAPPPPHASSSSSFGSLPSSALADHQARLLGPSSDYQSLARWFVTLAGTDFAGLVCSSFPHLLPDLARDFTSGPSPGLRSRKV